MPILQLPSNPTRSTDRTNDPVDDSTGSQEGAGMSPPGRGDLKPLRSESVAATQPVKVRTGRYGEMEEHELIHLLDSLDDERSRARFRESVYISVIVYLTLGWFLFYGPRILFHQPEFRDPIALMKQHDKELTYITPTAPKVKAPPPVIDHKTMQQLQKQIREAPPTPQPPAQQPAPTQEEAHITAPPVAQPPMPLPSAPRPAQPSVEAPLPAAPRPNFTQNSPTARDAMRGGFRGGGDAGPSLGSAGPLQAGADILSDVGDWDPTAYMRRLTSDIKRNWDPLIPESVQAPLMKKGIVGIRFTVLRDGTIASPMILETRSGAVELDKAAWNAITSEGQFPPLPKEYHGQQLELRIGFFYNTPVTR